MFCLGSWSSKSLLDAGLTGRIHQLVVFCFDRSSSCRCLVYLIESLAKMDWDLLRTTTQTVSSESFRFQAFLSRTCTSLFRLHPQKHKSIGHWSYSYYGSVLVFSAWAIRPINWYRYRNTHKSQHLRPLSRLLQYHYHQLHTLSDLVLDFSSLTCEEVRRSRRVQSTSKHLSALAIECWYWDHPLT